MKYFKTTIFFVGLFAATGVSFNANAQNCGYNYLGTKTLYTAPVYKNIPPPAGYQPVFINHVGRHGARHLTKEVSTSFAYTLLGTADKTNGLTATGKLLREKVMNLDKVEQGKVKSISAEGVYELEGIGSRMAKQYKQVFPNAPILRVGYTKEIRTKQSAEAFLWGLKTEVKDSASVKVTTYADDVDLRFYDSPAAYKTFEEAGNWQGQMATLQQNLKINALDDNLIAHWFTPAFIKTLKQGDAEKLVSDVFGFATIAPSVKAEVWLVKLTPADINFAGLFTCDELTALSKVDVADDYLKKGPGMDNNGIQVRIAVPLLVNFINTTDNFVKTGAVNAELRFAHAETISPFATLLGIAKASKVAADITQLDAAWKSSEVIPLSANIQWVFYKKPGNKELLVKVLLNEQDAQINGLTTATFPYYNWTTLRAFYMDKLGKLSVKLTDDMELYLKDVK